jgi:hypothetical protein
LELIFDRARKEVFDKSAIRSRFRPLEPIFTAGGALDLELLPRFDRIPPPEFNREDDLTLARYARPHVR